MVTPKFVLKKSHLFALKCFCCGIIAFMEMRELGKIRLASIDGIIPSIFLSRCFLSKMYNVTFVFVESEQCY